MLAAICLMALGIAGCNDYETPQGVLGVAYRAIHENDLKLLRGVLTGSALERYGHTGGMRELRNRIGSLELVPGATRLLDVEKDFRGWTRRRVFEVEIVVQKHASPRGTIVSEEVLRLVATVDCRVGYVLRERWGKGSLPQSEHPGPDYDCNRWRGGRPRSCHYEESSSCRISDFSGF